MKRKLLCNLMGVLLIACMSFLMQTKTMAEDISIEDTQNNVIYQLSEYESGGYTAKIKVGEGQTKLNVTTPITDDEGNSYDIKNVAKISFVEKLDEVTFGEGIEVIDGASFKDMADDDVTVKFPSTITHINDGFVYAIGNNFSDVKVSAWLKNMASENGVVYAGKVAIYVKEGIKDLSFKNDCVQLANGTAMGNTDITKVTIPKTVKSIGGSAFSGCTKLSNVIFEEGTVMEDLDWRAFYNCISLTSFNVPDSVTRIGTETFAGCTNLEIINISENSRLALLEYGAFGYYPYVIDMTDFAYNCHLGVSTITPANGVPVKEIYIPAAALHPYGYGYNSCTATGLFAGCTTLKKVTFGGDEQTAEIPYQAFAGCTSLETVEYGKSVKMINAAAFADCSNLKVVNLDGVKEVGAFAFARTGLKEITIPENVQVLTSYALAGCTKLVTLNYNAVGTINYSGGMVKLIDILGLTSYCYYNNSPYAYIWSPDTQYYTPVRTAAQFRAMYPKQTALQHLNIGDCNGKTILDSASEFAAFVPSIEKVTLPEGVKVIPTRTFMCDYSLVDINMPDSITDIGECAFWGDVGVDIDFSKLTNLETIGDSAFTIINANGSNKVTDNTYSDYIENGGLSNIILPDSVKSIGFSAFFGQRNVKKIVIPEGVERISSSAFKMNNKLEELEIYAAANYTNSSDFNNVFWNNRTQSLNKVTFGKKFLTSGELKYSLLFGTAARTVDMQMDNLINIGMTTFMNAKNLTGFNIPETVERIDQAAFMNTDSLNTITIPVGVKSIDVEAFRGSGLKEITILNKNTIIKEPALEVLEGEENLKTEVAPGSNGVEEDIEDYYAIPSNITIVGYRNSTAQKYAKEHGNKFVALDAGYSVTVDGNVSDVAEGDKFILPNTAKYGYLCGDGKMYKASSEITVTSDMTFTSVNTLSVNVANGAAIRTTTPAGLKFKANVITDNTDAVKSDAVKTGMLITANDLYENNESDLSLTSSYKVLNILNQGWADADTLTYYGAVANITEANYTRDFVARAYVTVTYVDGLEETYYSNVADKRNVSYVASKVLADSNNGLNSSELNVVSSFIK